MREALARIRFYAASFFSILAVVLWGRKCAKTVSLAFATKCPNGAAIERLSDGTYAVFGTTDNGGVRRYCVDTIRFLFQESELPRVGVVLSGCRSARKGIYEKATVFVLVANTDAAKCA